MDSCLQIALTSLFVEEMFKYRLFRQQTDFRIFNEKQLARLGQ